MAILAFMCSTLDALLAGGAAVGKTSLVSMLSSGGKAFPKNYKMVRSAAPLRCCPIEYCCAHPLLPDQA